MMVRNIFLTAADAVIDFLFAPRCAVCNDYIEERRDMFCARCRATIIAVDSTPEHSSALDEVWRITRYREGSREMLRALKFNDGRRADEINQLNAIRRILEMALDRRLEGLLARSDVAVPVPLHENRQSERGFNQVEIIFGEWLSTRGLAIENVLSRVKDTKHLFDLNREERQAVIGGAFSMVEGADVRGKKILLLDDIYTTGTTMSECAAVLKANGAKKVFGLVLASDFD